MSALCSPPFQLYWYIPENNQDVLWKERSRLRNKLDEWREFDGCEEDASVLRGVITV
jgi:hypothetical protein